MKIFFVSLGCDKNLVDSEHMLGILQDHGYSITDDEQQADIIVINTCCFINDAKEESIQTILDMGTLRTEGSCKALIVTGCLAQRYRDEIRTQIPEVDAVVGISSWDRITEAIEQVLAGGRAEIFDDISAPPGKMPRRVITTGGHYAYLKIAEGCDKNCTYCIIPKVRGRYRSIPMEDLLEEASKLAERGVKELILVAQETTLYGTDLYGEKRLHELIRSLCAIPQIRWIRLLYCYPEEIYPQLIETMKEEEKFCHYLDLPIQHCNDTILRRMGRRMTKEELVGILENLRSQIPDIVLRTTLITGFPGETQEQHEEMMDFVDEMEFDRLGVFSYSREENTPAAVMPDQIPEETKEKWRDELMQLQQEVSADLAQRRIGKQTVAMIEGKAVDEDVYVARTRADAPEVDGYLFLKTDEVLYSGDFVRARITQAGEYDLIGELI